MLNCEHWDEENKKNDAFVLLKIKQGLYLWKCKFCEYEIITKKNKRPIIAKDLYTEEMFILLDYEEIQ